MKNRACVVELIKQPLPTYRLQEFESESEIGEKCYINLSMSCLRWFVDFCILVLMPIQKFKPKSGSNGGPPCLKLMPL